MRRIRAWVIICGVGLILGCLSIVMAPKILDRIFVKGSWHEWSLPQKQNELTEELALEYAVRIMKDEGYNIDEWKPDKRRVVQHPSEEFLHRMSPTSGAIRYINSIGRTKFVELELKKEKIRARGWRESK